MDSGSGECPVLALSLTELSIPLYGFWKGDLLDESLTYLSIPLYGFNKRGDTAQH